MRHILIHSLYVPNLFIGNRRQIVLVWEKGGNQCWVSWEMGRRSVRAQSCLSVYHRICHAQVQH